MANVLDMASADLRSFNDRRFTTVKALDNVVLKVRGKSG